MTRPLATIALLALALTSCAATLAVRGTAPATLAEGSCARPIESPATSPAWVVATVAGFTDSVLCEPGAAFAFRWTLPPGTYTVTVWARNGGGASCSTSITLAATSRPSAPKVEP